MRRANKTEKGKRLKSIGTPTKIRPNDPPKDPNYPTKQDIALGLLRRFRLDFGDIKLQCVLADALYGDKKFMGQASHCFGDAQVISQLKTNQQKALLKHNLPALTVGDPTRSHLLCRDNDLHTVNY